MNKTLLLIICDFLLLNLIHFTAWDTLDEQVEQEAATGGSTEALARPGMGDISRDLELITQQYKNTEAELKTAVAFAIASYLVAEYLRALEERAESENEQAPPYSE